MNLHFMFPASVLNPRTIDEAFQDQAIALKNAGFGTSAITIDGEIVGRVPEGDVTVVYRGWMMSEPEYNAYQEWCLDHDLKLFTDVKQYLAAHWLPNWYPLVERWTPTTQIFSNDTPLMREDDTRKIGYILGEHVRSLRGLHHLSGHGDGSEWQKFQLKDYVKSLKTDGGSALTEVEDITPTLEKMQKYRGKIEGGICIRSWEDLYQHSEKRYFVINNRFYGQERSFDLRHMSLLDRMSKLIPSPFYSVDIALRTDGVSRIVEIGDGQVSDLVGWTPERFAEVWKEATS